MYSKYLNPKNDFAFKKIFGEEKNKGIPIAFLNAVLELKDDDKIIDLQFINPHQPPEILSRKESIVDVLVRDQNGTAYIIEMQVAHIAGFENRAEFYASKTFVSDFKHGGEYITLKKVVFLAITDYIAFPKKKEVYKSTHQTLDIQTSERDLENFSFTFVELPKFNKKFEDLETIEDRWYYFLKHAEDSENIEELIANNQEIQEAYKVLEKCRWTEEELSVYESIVMKTADDYGLIDAAQKEGEEKGRKEGRKEGEEEGEKRGEKSKATAIAKALLKNGMSPDEVSEITGLPTQDVQSLVKEKV